MSHGARVIRTGVSSSGPPPATAASSSAGSDVELVDGGYFRSCAGMLKVAQMVRGGRGGGRSCWGPGAPGIAHGAGGPCGGRGAPSGRAGAAPPAGLALAAPGRTKSPRSSGREKRCRLSASAPS